jgi:hypothetical protein
MIMKEAQRSVHPPKVGAIVSFLDLSL